ncbi:MAG TPA: AAA family ATPase, partial [Polyangiaceae bacterium]
MRFLKLGFSAFGPFTGLELDLAGGEPGGFHLIFGPNEAGKSSALRGVHDLLFGFPLITQDAHVHPNAELCIAATLADDAGKPLSLQRLKRRKDSLRDEHGAPLDEAALGALLGGVDARVFARLFGLDHVGLAEAGQALLDDKGDVGESLFDAGSGGLGIRRVLGELEQRADEIFKPRSSKARLNLLVEAYKEAKSALRDAQVSPEKWQSQAHKLDQEKTRLEALVDRRKRLREELIAQTRLQQALGPIAQRNALREKLEALGAVPALAPNARERRERAQRTLDEATHERARLDRESSKKRDRLAELIVPENLLGVSADAIERLRDRVGGHRTAEKDLPRRREDVRRGEASLER